MLSCRNISPPGSGKGEDGQPSEIISSSARDHFRLRRAMLPAFSKKALDEQEPLIRVYVDMLIDKLHGVAAKSQGQSTNMVRWYTFTTFDLIGDLAFGESFDGLKSGRQNALVANIERMMRLFPILVLAGSSPLLSNIFLLPAGKKIKESRQEHLGLVKSLATQRYTNTRLGIHHSLIRSIHPSVTGSSTDPTETGRVKIKALHRCDHHTNKLRVPLRRHLFISACSIRPPYSLRTSLHASSSADTLDHHTEQLMPDMDAHALDSTVSSDPPTRLLFQ